MMPGIRNKIKISGTIDRISGAPNDVIDSWKASPGFGSRSGESGSNTATVRNTTASKIPTTAQNRPRDSSALSGSMLGISDMSPSTGVSLTSLGSTTLSVSHQPIPITTMLDAPMKNQLASGLTYSVGSSTCPATSVMPASMGSIAEGIKLAENPPDTPAKAAAMPASGCRPAA